MGFSTEIDFHAVETSLGRLEGFSEGKTIAIAAKIGKEEILRKTEAGVDRNSVPFKPYKPRYAKIRDKRGYRTDIVNLRVTGAMLDSLHLENDTLTFDEEQKPIAQGNIEKLGRDFMGLEDDSLDKIEAAIWDELSSESEGWISNY